MNGWNFSRTLLLSPISTCTFNLRKKMRKKNHKCTHFDTKISTHLFFTLISEGIENHDKRSICKYVVYYIEHMHTNTRINHKPKLIFILIYLVESEHWSVCREMNFRSTIILIRITVFFLCRRIYGKPEHLWIENLNQFRLNETNFLFKWNKK